MRSKEEENEKEKGPVKSWITRDWHEGSAECMHTCVL